MITNKRYRTAWVSWCEAVHRADLELEQGDTVEALARYRETMGLVPRATSLHPGNQKLAEEADGVDVPYSGGCLAW